MGQSNRGGGGFDVPVTKNNQTTKAEKTGFTDGKQIEVQKPLINPWLAQQQANTNKQLTAKHIPG